MKLWIANNTQSKNWNQLLSALFSYHIKWKKKENQDLIIGLIIKLQEKFTSYWDLIKVLVEADKININKKINEKYSEWVFILKQWDLEEYLWITKKQKWLQSVINFCKDGFTKWYKSKTQKKKEIIEIFDHIIND